MVFVSWARSLSRIVFCRLTRLSKATLTHYSSKLKCGVANFGIGNWVTFLENTAPVRRANRRLEYGDESDPVIRAFLERISPLNNAKKINVPLFITHGETDTRVTVHEAVAMYKIVRGIPGGQAQLVICEGEGHGEFPMASFVFAGRG